MTESAKYEAYKKKLEGICDENDLVYGLDMGAYPMTMTIKPLQGLDATINMLEQADEKPFNSPDAMIQFFMEDGELKYKLSERFQINDALFSKLRNLFRNLHLCYLEMFHRDVVEQHLLNRAYEPSTAAQDTNEKLIEPLEEDAPDDADQEEGDDFPEGMLDESGAFSDPVKIVQPAKDSAISRAEWLIGAATKHVRERGFASVSDLSKRFTIGYADAARLMDDLEEAGVIGGQTPNGRREVLPEGGVSNG